MELKRVLAILVWLSFVLLIELYGIETSQESAYPLLCMELLIELYGIETEKLHCLDYWLYV